MPNLSQDMNFSLATNHIHTWFVNFDISEEKIMLLRSFLSEDEIIKASKFRFEKDKNCFVISRGVLRVLSSKYLDIEPQHITFRYGEYGKPDFNFDTNLNFNISHSGEMAILSFVKEFDIGSDIEKIKSNFDVLDISNNFFSTTEIEALKKQPKQDLIKGFYRCWTRKESFIKAKGQGLSFPLDSFSVSLDSDDEAHLLETKWEEYEKDTWNLFSFSPKEGYIGAISVQGEIKKVEYFNFNDYFNTLPE